MRRAAVIGLLAAPALAAPPQGADPDLAPWFRSLTVPDSGALCCDIADCRAVRARLVGDHYEAYIDSATFPDDASSMHGHAPNAWVRVPDKAVLRRHDNPNGEAIACWYAQEIRCFIEASGV